jgi:hypothetical protein
MPRPSRGVAGNRSQDRRGAHTTKPPELGAPGARTKRQLPTVRFLACTLRTTADKNAISHAACSRGGIARGWASVSVAASAIRIPSRIWDMMSPTLLGECGSRIVFVLAPSLQITGRVARRRLGWRVIRSHTLKPICSRSPVSARGSISVTDARAGRCGVGVERYHETRNHPRKTRHQRGRGRAGLRPRLTSLSEPR